MTSSRDRRGARYRQRGAALVEFVIVAPIFVGLVYASMYLTELGSLRLEAQEIARFGAWGLATRPLSDYADQKHGDAVQQAQRSVNDEMLAIYADLDAARDSATGRVGVTQSGLFVPAPMDLRVRDVALLPGGLSAEWASPLSTLGMVLNMLGIGTGTQDLFGGPFRRMGFNPRGEVHARARLYPIPPLREQSAASARALAAQGAQLGVDLSRWNPTGLRPIRDLDSDGTPRDIAVVLVADPWRLPEGFTAHPVHPAGYASMVDRVSDRAIEALPGGTLINAILGLAGFADRLPGGLSGAFGVPPDDPAAHVFSRPYAQRRSRRPRYNAPRVPGMGYVNVFADTGGNASRESAQVQNFESMPLYLDHSLESGYLDALNDRGNNFMGCPRDQSRRCSW